MAVREEINPFAYDVDAGDRITVKDGSVTREVTVLETVDDERGFGIVVETDAGREFTVGPEHFEGRI